MLIKNNIIAKKKNIRDTRQSEAVKAFKKGGILLASPRFGKTKVCLETLKGKNILIIIPNNDLKIGWKNEIEKWKFKGTYKILNKSSIKKITNKFKAIIRVNNLKTYFFISNNFQNNILNILATLSVMSIFIDISKLKKNIFLSFKIPNGRGDIAKIKIDNKKLNLIDESYNSNPLSLKSSILTRSCSIESLWRMVTVLSSLVS